MVKKITKGRSIAISMIADLLKKESNARELSLFQKRTLEYINKFSKMKNTESKRLIKRLVKLGDITEDEAIQIVNLMPKSREELKTIFYHRKTIIMTDFLDKILQLLWKGDAPKQT